MEVLVGRYVRLSVEDNGKSDCESIENQKELIQNFLDGHPHMKLVATYEDNGYTGTDFNRPGFTRMIEDARHGKINCIIVKDFSRLGRNYLEVGDYIEKVFPFLGIRFISILDDFDSASASSGDLFSVSFKNVMNDMYAKDISKKICPVMKEKRIRGEYVGSYAPYGYLKDPENKNRLIIDPEVAPIVVEIFELRATGLGIAAICRILNDRDYPSPGRLRFERGIITNNNKKGSELPWNRHVLKDLLLNIAYIGNLAQGKSSSCLYKGQKFHRTDSSEWDIAEGTHEPIISKELWDKVQAVNAGFTNAAKETHGKYAHLPKRANPYGSLLHCADCGRVLKYVRTYTKPNKEGVIKDYYNYKCPQNIELGDTACPKKNIRADDLDTAILELIKKQMDAFLEIEHILKGLIASERAQTTINASGSRIAKLKGEIKRVRSMSATMYTDYKSGLITQDEYVYGKNKLKKELDSLELELRELQVIKDKTCEIEKGNRNWNRIIEQFYSSTSVSAEMVEAMIEEIILNSENEITIKFKFMSEFEEMLASKEKIQEVVA